MIKRLLTPCRLLFWPVLMAAGLIQCNKPNDSGVTPTPVSTVADTLRTGAQLLEKSKYEALPLLKDPLVGARIGAGGKDPKLPASYGVLSAFMGPGCIGLIDRNQYRILQSL